MLVLPLHFMASIQFDSLLFQMRFSLDLDSLTYVVFVEKIKTSVPSFPSFDDLSFIEELLEIFGKLIPHVGEEFFPGQRWICSLNHVDFVVII